MATLQELLAIQNELDAPQQAASLDELLAIQQELDQQEADRADLPGAPVDPSQAQRVPQEPGFLEQGVSLAGEVAAGANRAILGLGDIALSPVNVALQLAGQDRIPPLTGIAGQPGDIAGEGLPAEIASAVGELGTAGLGAGGALRAGAALLPETIAGKGAVSQALSRVGFDLPKQQASLAVSKQLAASTPALDVAAGAGAGAGQEIGEDIGGEVGQIVGALAGGLAGAGVVQGAPALARTLVNKFGKNIDLIDVQSGLPTPELQKALAKRDMDFGSIINEADSLPRLSGKMTPDEVVDQIVKRKLKTGATDNALATIKLDQGRIVADELGEEAVKQGFKAGDVAGVKGANAQTKREMGRILNMTRAILADSSKVKDFRPTDVVGEIVMSRFTGIRDRANTLRDQLNAMTKRDRIEDPTKIEGPESIRSIKGLKIDTDPVSDNFSKELDDLLITSEGSPPKLDFTNSLISEDPTSQRVIESTLRLLKKGEASGSVDAVQAHNLKKQLDNMLDFNKKSAPGLTDAGKKFAKSIRRSLNESIRDVSPQYAKVNDELSLAITTMDDFQKVLGTSKDLFAPGASKAVGDELRSLLSNIKKRTKLENSLDNIDSTFRQMGGNTDVDVKDLVKFANIMDDQFGAIADTSFKGQIASGIKQAGRGVDTPKQAVKEFIFEKGAELVEKVIGANDTGALNAMQRILRRN